MQISAQQAIIKTAAVEIKSLTVSGKQVTLAVFRQLDQAPLLEEGDDKLNGIPWGRVNYHPDKCESHEEHIHIVWQKGSTLYRDAFYKTRTAADFTNEELKNCRSAREKMEELQWRRDQRRLYGMSPDEMRAKEEWVNQNTAFNIDVEIYYIETYKSLKNLDLLFIAV